MAIKVELTPLPGSKLEIRVQADAAEVEKAYEGVFTQLSEHARIPGFRAGHAPRAIMERRFPPEELRAMAWREFLEKSFAPALEEQKVRPLGEPELPDLEQNEAFQRGADFEMVTSMAVQPVPELPDYSALKLVKPSAEVTSEDVEEHLERLRSAHAKSEPADHDEVAEGDMVQACVHIREEDGTELEHYDAEVKASATSENEIEKALIGAKQGAEVEYDMTLNEPQDDPALVGKTVKVAALVEAINQVTLPEVDADFAKTVDESLDSVEGLREYLEQRLQEQFARDAERTVRNLAVAVVDRGTRLELPQALVQNMTNQEARRLHERLRNEGLSHEAALEMMQDKNTGLMEQAMIGAVEGLRLHYIFAAIAEAEGLEPGEDEINAAMAEYAQDYGLDEGHLRQMVAMQPESEEEFFEQALRKLVIDHLLGTAVVEEVSREGYPLMARRIMEEAQAAAPGPPPVQETLEAAESSEEDEAPAATEASPEPEATEES